MPQPSATIGVRGCRLPALKGLKRSAAASTRHATHSHLPLSAFEAAVCAPSKLKNIRGSFDRQRRPGTQATAASTRHAQATAICYYRRSRLPFARPQRPKTFRGSFNQQALKPEPSATIGVRGCRFPALKGLIPIRGSFDQARRPQPSATIGVRGCRLPKGLKRSAAFSTRHAGHSHLLLSAFEAAVWPPSKASCKRSAATWTRHSGHSHLLLSVSKMPFVALKGLQTLRGSFDQALRPQPSATCSVRSCRLPALKGLIPIRGSFDQLLWPQCRA